MNGAKIMVDLQKTLLDLKKMQKIARHVDEVRRASLVRHYYSGFTIEETASYFDFDAKTVKFWIKRYEKFGIPGLKKKLVRAVPQS